MGTGSVSYLLNMMKQIKQKLLKNTRDYFNFSDLFCKFGILNLCLYKGFIDRDIKLYIQQKLEILNTLHL